MKSKIRKLLTVVDETSMEMGRPVTPPVRRAVACAVIENPFAGRYVEDLTPLVEISEELGELLTQRCIAALGISGGKAESYGKAAIVGEAGELEHAAALLHPKMGTPVRKVLEKGAALIPSAKKSGGPGTAIDVPLGHKDAAYVRITLRRHRSARARCAARQRDRRVRRRNGRRPPPAEGRRLEEGRDQGGGWVEMNPSHPGREHQK